jgi:hypothetical protein
VDISGLQWLPGMIGALLWSFNTLISKSIYDASVNINVQLTQGGRALMQSGAHTDADQRKQS